MNDLRSLLYQLADRLSEGLAQPPAAAPAAAVSAENAPLRAALSALAEGHLTARFYESLPPSAERAAIEEHVAHVRALVRAAVEAAEEATPRNDALTDAIGQTADAVNRQRVVLDRAAEQLRTMPSLLEELARNSDELSAAGERVALLALNTGIEGLRVGGEVARALGTLGDEIRRIALKASVSARGISEGLRIAGASQKDAVQSVEEARTVTRTLGDAAARAVIAAETSRLAETSLTEAASTFHLMDAQSEALVSRLDEAAARIARDVGEAQAMLGAHGEGHRASEVAAALVRLERAARGHKGA